MLYYLSYLVGLVKFQIIETKAQFTGKGLFVPSNSILQFWEMETSGLLFLMVLHWTVVVFAFAVSTWLTA